MLASALPRKFNWYIIYERISRIPFNHPSGGSQAELNQLKTCQSTPPSVHTSNLPLVLSACRLDYDKRNNKSPHDFEHDKQPGHHTQPREALRSPHPHDQHLQSRTAMRRREALRNTDYRQNHRLETHSVSMRPLTRTRGATPRFPGLPALSSLLPPGVEAQGSAWRALRRWRGLGVRRHSAIKRARGRVGRAG